MKINAEPPAPTGKTWLDVAREVLPGWSDEDLNWALWEHTGFPVFFDGDPEACVRRQLNDLAVGMTLGLTLCDFCHSHTFQPYGWAFQSCPKCDEMMAAE